MRRQPPAPLLEDDPEEVSLADTTAGPGQEGITNENGQNRRVEVPGEPTTWRKSQSPESSPRSRASASWKRQSPIERGPDKSLDSAILLAHGKSREVMADLRSSRRTDIRSPWSCSLLTITTTLVAFLLVLSIIHSSLTRQLDPQGCVMSRMSPTYIKLSGFDTEHTRFATKYSLYLYREEGVDEYAQDRIGLRGVPVLFLPGNAGSYKQVRSLSSEASRYFHEYLRHDQSAIRSGARSLDFFTVDFNEDLAAFHGRTLLDQAEYVNEAVAYIISLYHDPRRSQRDEHLPDPSSVVLIGHSMGGFVARTVLVTPNYQSNSVNTIITMSTPHARPPVSFDADLVSTYQRINDYWRESYTQKWASNNPLWHTTLISIAGGGPDTTVPSDYASLSSLVPESHGFTVFTSTIPDVWTSMDHLAITWADQIRKVIVKSLFEVIDVRRSSQTKPRAERMKIFRRWYLTGLEEDTPKYMLAAGPSVLLTLGDGSRSTISQSTNVTLRRLGMQSQTTAKLLPIPPADSTNGRVLSVLTDQSMDPTGSFDKLEVLFCSAFPLHASHSLALLPAEIDLSDGSPGATRLACKKPAGDAIHLPASTRSSKNAFDQVPPFTFLQYTIEDLSEHQFVAVIDRNMEPTRGWVIAEIAHLTDSSTFADIGLPELLMTGLRLELPAKRPLVTKIKVPALHSSLLAYSLRLESQGCGGDGLLFAPLVRQYVNAPYESKFFVNFKQGDINLHGVAPFMPPPLSGIEHSDGVTFQIWADPNCDASLDFALKVDLIGSMGKLVIRYRTVFAAFPLLVVAMVLRKQFRVYDNTGIFMTFAQSLDQSLRLPLPLLLLSMTFFATAFSNSKPSGLGFRIHQNATELAVDYYTQNDLLLGSQDAFFWFLVPLAGLISIGACVTVNYFVLAIVYAFSIMHTFVTSKSAPTRIDDGKKTVTAVSMASSPRRRIINTTVLLVLVSTVIPYQFAFIVACIVQLATCTRALQHASESRSGPQYNLFNYAQSVLVLMLWILPIHLPVLVVWVHNLAVHWLTPFSSHHNVLSIMPFILLVETLTGGSMVPRMTTRIKWATNVLLFILAICAAVYGVTYAYRLHHLANLFALWLVVLHCSANPGISVSRFSRLFDTEEDLETPEVKKMP